MKLTIKDMGGLLRQINDLSKYFLSLQPHCLIYQTKDQIESQGALSLTPRFVYKFFPGITMQESDFLLLPNEEDIRVAVEIINSDFDEYIVEEKLQWLASNSSNYSGVRGFKYVQDSWEEYLFDKNTDDMPTDNLYNVFCNYYTYLKIWCLVSELCYAQGLPNKRRKDSYEGRNRIDIFDIRFSDYFFNSDQFNFFWDLSLRYPKYLPNIFKRIFEFRDFFGSSKRQKFLRDNGLYVIAMTLLTEIIICHKIPFYEYIKILSYDNSNLEV